MNYSIQPSSSIDVIKDEMTAPNYYSKKESGKIILGYKDTSNLFKIGFSTTRYGEGLFKEWNRKDSKMIGYEKLYAGADWIESVALVGDPYDSGISTFITNEYRNFSDFFYL